MFEWLSTRDPIFIYIFLFFNAFFESIFPPYPSDAFVLVFSFIAGRGSFNPIFVYIFTVLGNICGIMIIYYIGREYGKCLIQTLSRTFFGRLLPIKMIEESKQKFARYGDLIILLNRFFPGMRAPICFTAGIVGIRNIKVFVYALISILIWNLFLVSVGFYIGTTWVEASKFLRNYNIIVTIIMLVCLTVLILVYFLKKRKK